MAEKKIVRRKKEAARGALALEEVDKGH